MKRTTTALKNEFKNSNNTYIAEPNLELLPLR